MKRIYQALQMSLKDSASKTVSINNEWIDTNANEYTMKWALVKDGKEVDAKRIFGIMSLGVKKDNLVTVKIEGEDEETACSTLEAFFQENL